MEDVEDEARDEHLATRGAGDPGQNQANMQLPQTCPSLGFHILAGFLGRSRQKVPKNMPKPGFHILWGVGLAQKTPKNKPRFHMFAKFLASQKTHKNISKPRLHIFAWIPGSVSPKKPRSARERTSLNSLHLTTVPASQLAQPKPAPAALSA